MSAATHIVPAIDPDRQVIATQWQLMWWKFRDHRIAYVSLYVLGALYLATLFCEFLSPHDPNQRSALYRHAPPQAIHIIHDGSLRLPFVYPMVRHVDPETRRVTYQDATDRPLSIQLLTDGDTYEMWSLFRTQRHLFGIDDENGERLLLLGADRLGRDLLSRILYGSRISLTIGLVGVTLSLVLGVIIGGISGFYGGMIDAVVQRVIEVLRSFPTLPLWLSISAAIPATWSNVTVYFAMTVILSLIGWTGLARVVRGKFLALREEDYVAAAKVAGVRELTIIRRHLVPGFLSHLIVSVTLAIPGMILAETSLSFLRLGLRPPSISWGVLLQDAQSLTALQLYPWLMIPALFVIITVLAFNFIGDGLRDAADPYKI
ncbi:MAG: ABC transporter permease [Gemmatimonadetes bacterium]|jgi:peptide/nickel transport system permease protein|nr:ABC transporter permease [Gemmatimonadota bacterium]MBT6145974.1 ABC transporter permease [Gemmatimonadota bacterium]MBT7858974.1 ABC transporter permease [Gemmatimonadota bacterium]